MNYFAPRTCAEFQENASRAAPSAMSRPIESFRTRDAYVLLGAPGAGKTEIFKHEAVSTNGHYVSARNFMTFEDRAEWHDKTLYIDGLDEMRTGAADGRTPLDRIRNTLDRLERPRFRLSCRATDWLGANDRDHLKTVSRNEKLTVLYLDPLTDEDIRRVLKEDGLCQNPDEFISSAKEKGVDSLLTNPHSLKLLVKAVAGGDWPETRTETFGAACLTLLKEHNQEHQAAGSSVDTSSLMQAAGRLCAIQILTGKAGYTLPGNQDGDEFPGVEQVPGADRKVLHLALGSKLFDTPDVGRVCPAHRQIAEYLAARYLAGLVENGLPAGRILALTTGYDGGVVSDLRGLVAWLAACSRSSRSQIISRDPLGTILYGDVRNFSAHEKLLLLKALGREVSKNRWTLRAVQMDPRLGDVFTPDMEQVLHEIFADAARDYPQQSFVRLLIEMLAYSRPCPGLADIIMQILRDGTRWAGIRQRAVHVFARHQEGEAAFAELAALAEDVSVGHVSDPNDNLLGFLLEELYPGRMPASEVIQYLKTPKSASYTGKYKLFWTWHVPERASTAQLAELLDELVAHRRCLSPATRKYRPTSFFLQRVPLVLLGRLLSNTQKAPDSQRLFDWLGIAMGVGDWGRETRIGDEEKKTIAHWLSRHPKLWKSLFITGLKRCLDSSKDARSSEFLRCMYMEERRVLLGIEKPPDFGLWCLEQAIAAEQSEVAEYFLKTAQQDQPSQVIEARISGNTKLLGLFREILAAQNRNAWNSREKQECEPAHDKHKEYQKKIEAEKYRKQQEWYDRVSSQKAELEANRGAPNLLHPLSITYFGGYSDVVGGTPEARLQSLLGTNQDLVETVLKSFRGAVRREDLPTASKVIELHARQRIHLLALPFMAGLEEITNGDDPDFSSLQESQLQLACAVRYTAPVWPRYGQLADSLPHWYEWLLGSHPEMISKILLSCVRANYRHGTEFGAALHNELANLSSFPEYADVARLTSLALLKTFPVRCIESQLPTLRKFLQAAYPPAEPQRFLELIEGKLKLRGMNVAQRVYWLAMGLLASPGIYREKLIAYVTGKERRIAHLTELFLGPGAKQLTSAKRLEVPTLQSLISLFGSGCQPFRLDTDSNEGGAITRAMEVSMHVKYFINQLASHDEMEAARQALAELHNDKKLHLWRPHLEDAACQQDTLYRDAHFHHCNTQQVVKMLDNLHPANAADLAALTAGLLKEISDVIRNGNTSDWRQYWKFDSRDKPRKPMHEDDCRDRLLSDLQTRLQGLGIDAQPEGRYADDKRADIRIAYHGFNVPVEIKKSCSRDLWSAIEDQLISKYTPDPEAHGYGIYLVLWFGHTQYCQPTRGSEPLPKCAGELEEQLLNQLSSDEKRKISICVIDVTKPHS